MNKRILAVAGLVSTMGAIGAPALSGEMSVSHQSIAQQAVERLKIDLPQAKFQTEAARITRIYGQPLAVGGSALDSAEKFRLRHAEVFGVDAEDLRAAKVRAGGPTGQPVMYDRSTGEYKFTLFRYVHQENGIPVFRSELRLLVRNAANSPVVLASSSLRPLKGFAPDLAVARRALDPASIVPGMEEFTQPETVIWAGADGAVEDAKLAHVFVGKKGANTDDYEKWLYVTDAVTGEILHKENRIIRTDVSGSVTGLATQGPKTDFCSTAAPESMPWSFVRIQGGASAYADELGDFVISNPGTTDVTVESSLIGRYFILTDFAIPEELLTQTVTPPGPADFLHNAADTSELVRAQTNAYVESNIVRDFVLTYNPSFPVISTQVDFPVRVNRVDFFCPGNAWYDFESINFCRAGAGFPNTAFSVIVHHEYGHHMVESAGSGQAAYGEGFGDTMAVLIEDQPVLALGWTGDCNSGPRSADNTLQYPCSGGIHFCGQLLSGCVWSTRNELILTNPTTYRDIISNLTVNSVLLHTGGGITPTITIDFLALDDDDGDLGNGTPHWDEICAGFGAHGMDCPAMIACNVPSDCPDPDGLFCTGPDCRNGLCYYVDDPCDDGELCTQDLCDEATDTCSNPPLDCSLGDPCIVTFCHPQLGCGSISEGNTCNDGLFCNGSELCSNGNCSPGIPPCSAGCCDEAIGACRTCNDDGVCDPGEICSCCPSECIGGGVVCGNGICQTADGEDCISCPDDCNGKTGGNPNNRYCCGDGSAQNGVTCSDPRCTADGNTCSTTPGGAFCCGDGVCEDIEDETNCAVDCGLPCTTNGDCDDGDDCTIDLCEVSGCVNTPINCADGDACTADSCSGGVCSHDPITCDDGDTCTTDSCNIILGCEFLPIDCDDGDACTADSCSGGICANDPVTCDDGDACTTDTCDSATGCVFTPIPGCSSCAPRGTPCSDDAECCSTRCRGGSCK